MLHAYSYAARKVFTGNHKGPWDVSPIDIGRHYFDEAMVLDAEAMLRDRFERRLRDPHREDFSTAPPIPRDENERRAQAWMAKLRPVLGYDPFPAYPTAADFVAWYRHPKLSEETAALRTVGWFAAKDGPEAGDAPASARRASRPIAAVLRELGVTATERVDG